MSNLRHLSPLLYTNHPAEITQSGLINQEYQSYHIRQTEHNVELFQIIVPGKKIIFLEECEFMWIFLSISK